MPMFGMEFSKACAMDAPSALTPNQV